jgi:membrane protease YdiL (CAAX protease family)
MSSARSNSHTLNPDMEIPPDLPNSSSPPPQALPGRSPHEGLRALWGIVLFILLYKITAIVASPLFQTLFATHRDHQHQITPRITVALDAAAVLSVAAATAVMAAIESRSLADYGLGTSRLLRNFAQGLAWGVATLSLLVGLLHSGGLLAFDGRHLFGWQILRYSLSWAAAFLLVALAEEIFLRAYLQATLTRLLTGAFRNVSPSDQAPRLAFWTAAALLSIAFGASHFWNTGESPIGLLSAAAIGLVFCFSLWRTGSLWWAIGFHAAWDWMQSFFYGVADSGLIAQGHLFATHPQGPAYLSGGLTGPEGSILVFPITAVIAFIVAKTLPPIHRNHPQPEATHPPSLH